MAANARADSSQTGASLTHLLLVWALVGPSLAGFGVDLLDATPAAVPVSSLSAGLLFGTVLVAALWVAGFRPSIRASVGYFVATHTLAFLFVASSALLAPVEATLSPWAVVGLRGLSILLPAALFFTSLGSRVRDVVVELGRNVVRTPPE